MQTETPRPTWASMVQTDDGNVDHLVFDFPVLYIMATINPESPGKPSTDRPMFFLEDEQLPGFDLVQARLKDKDPIFGFGCAEMSVILFSTRTRWRNAEDPSDRPTLHMRPGTKSQTQVMAAILPADPLDGDPVLVTLTAKSSRSRSLLAGMTMASKLSTRGKVLVGTLAPTYMWRLRLSVGAPLEMKSERHKWTIHPHDWRPDSDTPSNLQSVAVDPVIYDWARRVWSNVGADWKQAWKDPEPGPEASTGAPEAMGDEQLEQRASGADEANARDEAALKATLAGLRARVAELEAIGADPASRAVDKRKAEAERAALVEKLREAGAL